MFLRMNVIQSQCLRRPKRRCYPTSIGCLLGTISPSDGTITAEEQPVICGYNVKPALCCPQKLLPVAKPTAKNVKNKNKSLSCIQRLVLAYIFRLIKSAVSGAKSHVPSLKGSRWLSRQQVLINHLLN